MAEALRQGLGSRLGYMACVALVGPMSKTTNLALIGFGRQAKSVLN